MRKICSLMMAVLLALGVSGCGMIVQKIGHEDISYTTKYIVNQKYVDVRKSPDNDAPVIDTLQEGEPVSFCKDVEDGYAQISYQGKTGYVLAINLSDEKMESAETAQKDEGKRIEAENVYVIYHDGKGESVKFVTDRNADLISHFSEDEVIAYIDNVVRPRYNYLTQNQDGLPYTKSYGVTRWMENKMLAKKTVDAGVGDYNMIRDYYYDAETGNLVFAFIHWYDYEFRLYFKDGQLIRFKDNGSKEVNNPTSDRALSMGSWALSEAYEM